MGNIFPRQPRYDFFDMMHGRPDWENSTILDVGGNRGNLLEDLLDLKLIKQSQYTSLDVDQQALDFGKQNFPDANWIKHNAFNNVYNLEGTDETEFPFDDNTFDLVCAYSVYSHTTFKQFVFDLIELIRVCKKDGSIALTVVDTPGVKFFTEKRAIDYKDKPTITFDQIAKLNIADYMYFVDNDLLLDEIYNQHKMDYLVTIYNIKWLSTMLNELNITHKMKFPPQNHVQRTLVIKKQEVLSSVEDLKKIYNDQEFLVDIT